MNLLKNFLFLCLTGSLISCGFFDKKIKTPEELVAQEKAMLQKNGVDAFPLLIDCEDVAPEAQKNCFYSTLYDRIAGIMEVQELELSEVAQDTLWVPILVNTEGSITVESDGFPEFLEEQASSLKTILDESLADLTVVSPANIRGIEVATRFKLPVVFLEE